MNRRQKKRTRDLTQRPKECCKGELLDKNKKFVFASVFGSSGAFGAELECNVSHLFAIASVGQMKRRITLHQYRSIFV